MSRPRKPTATLKLEGGLRTNRHADRGCEPQPKGLPQKPSVLTGHASAHWDSVVPSLIETGVVTSQDTPALTRLCEFWAEYETAKAKQKDRKRLMMMIAAHKSWIELASRFGLTPTDRARVVSEGLNKKRSATASHIA